MLILDNISAVKASTQVRQPAGVECCLAIWAARAPEREPLKEVAGEIQARMHPKAREALRRLEAAFEEWPLFAVNAFYGLGVDGLEESLGILRAEPPREVAVAFLGRRSRLGGGGPEASRTREAADGDHRVDPLADALRDERVRRASALIARPEETVELMLRVIEAFARAGFREIFEQQRERFAAVAAHLEPQLAGDVPKVICGLSPRAVLDPRQDRVTFVGGRLDRVVACEELERLDVIPTFWLRRRVVLAQAAGRAGLCISTGTPLPGEMNQQRTTSMLSALGEPRRFEIFLMCLERSRTTRELATALRITEGPVSRHLKELERGGLVVRQRTGRVVFYTAVVEVLSLLGRELLGLPQQALPPPPDV
jgi:DNA-binding transcriptional ArsR family regulator